MQSRPPYHQYSRLPTEDISNDEPALISDTKPEAGGTDEHATNPFVASYDIVDFLTTIAFVITNIAKSLAFFPMISNVLHIINYSLLGYIQTQGMVDLGDQQILDDEAYQQTKSEILPPKKGRKSNAEFAWDLAMYILKMMICVFLVALSIISTAVVAGVVATFVNAALLPIAYVLTTGINVLKFGKNLVKGIYDYFSKSKRDGLSVYQKNHEIIASITKDSEVTNEELSNFIDARNVINKAGRDNIQNSIFFGLSAGFLAGSILFVLSSTLLMSAVIPPLGLTIGSALFVASGVLFAAHGISVLANVIRKSRGMPEKNTFFGWITEIMYPTATESSIRKKYNLTVQQDDSSLASDVNDSGQANESASINQLQEDVVEIKEVNPYSFYPFASNGFHGALFSHHNGVKAIEKMDTLGVSPPKTLNTEFKA